MSMSHTFPDPHKADEMERWWAEKAQMDLKTIEDSFEEYYGKYKFETHAQIASDYPEWPTIFVQMKAALERHCNHLAEVIKVCDGAGLSNLVRDELTQLVLVPSLGNPFSYRTTIPGARHVYPFAQEETLTLVHVQVQAELRIDRKPKHGYMRFQCKRIDGQSVECQWGIRFAFPSTHFWRNPPPPGSDGFSNPATVDVVSRQTFSFDDICRLLGKEPSPTTIRPPEYVNEETTFEGKSKMANSGSFSGCTYPIMGHTGLEESTRTGNKKVDSSDYGSIENSIANRQRSYLQVKCDSALGGQTPPTVEAKTDDGKQTVWGQLTGALSNATSYPFSCFTGDERGQDEKSEYQITL
ncbi:hypothetical protein QFC22_006156 [Naganishia vaughanmartiniae]|uniref:Uncharacterized protein n=1 Tax=Naganishia vaughanmartiniae TaxID=1424756 RepID=A0ACC2WP07_9TREE|nr:hypothetical protein QFC22_006156 [Naganishia vaughanmartiniae]